MTVPHPIPYQGSKRRLTPSILACFPEHVAGIVEPFAGSAAVTLAAISRGMVKRVVLGDLNGPLMELWQLIATEPDSIADSYETLWKQQIGQEKAFYDQIRREFNRTHRPDHLLYLLLRCVKGAVRYNSNGEFNQSPDNRRRGMKPVTVRKHIVGASRLLAGTSEIVAGDYHLTLERARPTDIVYMDPPYQGVSGERDGRYIKGVQLGEFVESLRELNRRDIPYILSYDGRANEKSYGQPLPEDLELSRIEIDAGRSTQATLLGRDVVTYESLYLSRSLTRRAGKRGLARLTPTPRQANLFDDPSAIIGWNSGPNFQRISSTVSELSRTSVRGS